MQVGTIRRMRECLLPRSALVARGTPGSNVAAHPPPVVTLVGAGSMQAGVVRDGLHRRAEHVDRTAEQVRGRGTR